MKLSVVCVGKIKEKFFSDAIAEYKKRLSRYVSVEIVEVADEKTPEGASAALEDIIKDTEGERILAKIKADAYVIALAIEGKRLDSVGFAQKINSLCVTGTKYMQFVIGGSLGLSRHVLERADMLLSFSDMTFPHQLMRVILLEQIYRSQRIIRNEPYHK